MALDLTLIAKIDAGYNTAIPALFMQISPDDNKAAIAASAYFNTFAANLKIADTIISNGTDGTQTLEVTAVSPDVTTAVV